MRSESGGVSATDEGGRRTVIPNGPVIVRGAGHITDDDGVVHPVDRPVVAVCACGRTGIPPWCDSTHKAVRR